MLTSTRIIIRVTEEKSKVNSAKAATEFMREWFHRIAVRVSTIMGTPTAFVVACSIIFLWAISGPIFNFSDTWQLIINTGTTIVTFLMVILLQNTQNRDSKAMQLKLDELIRASGSARDEFLRLENLTDEDLALLDEDFERIGKHVKTHVLRDLHKNVEAEKARRNLITDPIHVVSDAIKKVTSIDN